MNSKMKAVFLTRYGPAEVLDVRQVDKPAPKNKEVFEAYKKHFMSLIYEDKYCQVYKIT